MCECLGRSPGVERGSVVGARGIKKGVSVGGPIPHAGTSSLQLWSSGADQGEQQSSLALSTSNLRAGTDVFGDRRG